MHRFALSSFLLAAVLAGGSPAFAQFQVIQPPGPPPDVQSPQPTTTTVFRDSEDARDTRERLQQLLRQLPPAVGEVLQRDPSLANPQYLAPYPALVAFLQQHPEVARNPSYFFGGFTFREFQPRDPAMEVFDDLTAGIGVLLILGGIAALFVWLVRTIIDQRRWQKVSRIQAEVHTKLLDRLTSNDDVLAYIQTPAGRRFLESTPIAVEGEPPRMAAPISRIVLSIQAGIVLAALGLGFWIARYAFPDDMAGGFSVLGTLVFALGAGFVLSAAAAYAIASRHGLMDTARPSHD